MLKLAGDNGTLAKHRKEETGWESKPSDQNKKAQEAENENIEYQDALKRLLNFGNDLARETAQDLEKLTVTIHNVLHSQKKLDSI